MFCVFWDFFVFLWDRKIFYLIVEFVIVVFVWSRRIRFVRLELCVIGVNVVRYVYKLKVRFVIFLGLVISIYFVGIILFVRWIKIGILGFVFVIIRIYFVVLMMLFILVFVRWERFRIWKGVILKWRILDFVKLVSGWCYLYIISIVYFLSGGMILKGKLGIY